MIYRSQPCHICGLSSCMHPRAELELLVDNASGPDHQVESITPPFVCTELPRHTWKFGAGFLLRGLRHDATFVRSQIDLESRRYKVTLEHVRIFQPAFTHWLEALAAGVVFHDGKATGADSFVLEILETRHHPAWSLGLQETFVTSFSNLRKQADMTTSLEIVLVPQCIVAPQGFPGWPR